MTATSLRNVMVPTSVLDDPAAFGGREVQDCRVGDLLIEGSKVVGLSASQSPEPARRLVMAKLTEPHVHLDKCHTIGRMSGVGGDLATAIEAQRNDRSLWTAEDIRARASRGLKELISAGCSNVRTHIDWGTENDPAKTPLAWDVLTEIAQDHTPGVRLQVSPLTGIDDMADGSVAESVAKTVSQKSNVLGSFVLDQSKRRDGIRQMFRVAEKYGLALDFHVDEGLHDGLNGIEIVAEVALETAFQGPILCGHACSLMNLEHSAFQRVAEILAHAGISIVSLPAANLYLQGRNGGTPDRRGVTRIRELCAAGVNVVIGTDNVRDAFCPLGQHDPTKSLALAALSAHLDPPFGQYLPMITTNAQEALGLAPTYVDGAAIGDLLVFDVSNTADLLAGAATPRPLDQLI